MLAWGCQFHKVDIQRDLRFSLMST